MVPDYIRKKLLKKFDNLLPYKIRGIKITENYLLTAIEILNAQNDKTLPQNARNAIMEKTPFGLDRLIKERTGKNLRTANIISDELEKRGIAEVFRQPEEENGRTKKHTRLNEDWTW